MSKPRTPHTVRRSNASIVDTVVETPKGSRCKYHLDERTGELRLKFILPAGAMFPYDFGFIPKTLAADGDPLDVLVFLDAPTYPGCVVITRLIGVIEAEQSDGKEVVRNDRLVGVAIESHEYRELTSLKTLNDQLRQEIEHFFVSYNEMRGKTFRIRSHKGPSAAVGVLEEGLRMAKGKRRARKR